MSRWNRQQQQFDFDKILSNSKNGYQLLSIGNLVEQAKSKSSKFTQKLLQQKNRDIFLQLIDIALNPRSYMQMKSIIISEKITHGAIQILSNLSQEFIQEIFDKQSQQQDSVIQGDKQYPIINHMFKVLANEGAEQTALAYLNKLVTPFIYQRSQEMIKLVNTQLLVQLLNYFWNQSISQIVIKTLEAQSQKDFFESQKVQLVSNLCRMISQEQNEQKVQKNIESFGDLVESLLQKHEDKYQKSKYAKLIKNILQDNNFFSFLFTLFQKYQHNQTIKIETLRSIETFLRIHLPVKGNSKISDQHEEVSESLKLHGEFRAKLQKFLQNHKIQQFDNDSRLQLLNYYKMVKSALLVDPSLVGQILTQSFLVDTLNLMKKDFNNNILHNFQREIIVHGIREQLKVCEIIQNQIIIQSNICPDLSQVSLKNSKSCFENQVLLIVQALKQRIPSQIKSQKWNQISSIIDTKRQFYSAIIGGDPRGHDDQKWDCIQNQGEILTSLHQKDIEVQKQTIEHNRQGNKKILVQISAGIEDLGGTQVLSEEEDDPFTSTNSMHANDTKNSHFFDDIQLPLDSDKEESDPNLSNSLDDLPIVIKIDSIIDNTLRNSQKGLAVSSQGLVKQEQKPQILLPIVVEQCINEQTIQIVIEESNEQEEIVQPRLLECCRQQIEINLRAKYGLTLKIQIAHKQQIETLIKCRYDLNLK